MTEKTIEEKLKEIRPYNHCRSCGHFIRVNFEGPKNVMHRQGFCMVGRLCGDFSLYYSASETECMAYFLLKEHAEIEIAETTLSESEKEFVRSTEDKRSKNYKTIEPLLNETREFIQKTQKEHAGLAMMMALREVETTAHKWYQENHNDEYMRVYKMVSLKKNDYAKYLAKITMLLHDEFCKCDKIKYTVDKVEGAA